MQKSKKLTAVYALIMDLPLSIVVTIVALLLSHNLSGQTFVMNFIIAYVVTFFVNFLPVGRWGFNFASKHSQPGTLKFALLINLLIAFVFVVILDLLMTAVGVLIFGHGTFTQYIFAVLSGFIPCYAATYVIAFFWDRVADRASRAICHEPAVMHQ